MTGTSCVGLIKLKKAVSSIINKAQKLMQIAGESLERIVAEEINENESVCWFAWNS